MASNAHSKRLAAIIVARMVPHHPGDGDDAGMLSAARDLIEAVHRGDDAGVAAALRSAFKIADSEPHEEGEHEPKP